MSGTGPTGSTAQNEPGAARRPRGPADPVSTLGCSILGIFLALLGITLLYSLVSLWPAVQAAASKANATPQQRTVSWFGLSYTPSSESALLIVVILVSALGSFLHAAVSFSDYVGNRRLTRSWTWWYLLRVLVGTSLAMLFYFAIRGGFFAGSTQTTDINPYGIAALAGLVGLFSKQATDKLREIFDTAFRVGPGYGDDARSNSITNPSPMVEAAEPPRLKAGEMQLVLVGIGFVRTSVVRVAQVGGPDLPREVSFESPQRLRVTLEAADVAMAGSLLFSVVNPPPGGGTSRPLTVEVDLAESLDSSLDNAQPITSGRHGPAA